MKSLKILQDLSDDELFNVMSRIGFEIKARIIKLLEDNNITCYTFDLPSEECPWVDVYDYNNGSTDIHVISVGYTLDMIGNNTTVTKNIYFVDANDRMWWGDDACLSDSIWDVYHELKSSIKC